MSPLGIMPLARELGERLGDWKASAPVMPDTLKPITTKPVRLDYRRWGFRSQAEMDRAFEGDGG